MAGSLFYDLNCCSLAFQAYVHVGHSDAASVDLWPQHFGCLLYFILLVALLLASSENASITSPEHSDMQAEEHHFADTVDGRLIADQLMRLLRREKAVGVEARWRLEVRRDNPFLIAHVFEKYLPGWSADSKDTGKYVHGEAPDDQVESNQEKKIGSIFVDSESEWRLLKNANHLRKLLLKTKQSDPHFTMAHFMRHMLTEVRNTAVSSTFNWCRTRLNLAICSILRIYRASGDSAPMIRVESVP